MKSSMLSLLIVTFTAFSLIRCGEPREEKATQGDSEQKTIAVAEILTEVNAFSPITTGKAEFEAESLLYGDEIIPYSREEKHEIAGFLEAVEDFGEKRITVVPIIKARAMPGGPVERNFYEHIKTTLLEKLASIENLNGLYLSMHGSMGVKGLRDPEGDILRSVRKIVGDHIPIGVSFDMHANITREKARNATFIVGYKTNPHRDFFDAGYRAGEILIKTIQGKVKPVMVYNKMRLLKGGGMQIDLLSPMRQIFSRMDDMEDSDAVLCVSNFTVHLWLNNEPELGWSTVVVTNNNRNLAQKLADELADLNWSVRTVTHHEGYTPSEAIEIARESWFLRKIGTVLFSDVSDNVLAGAPGENTWILKALMEKGADLTSYITIRDRDAARKAFTRKIGETITLTLGGKLERIYNRPLEFSGTLLVKKRGKYGKTVVLRNKGVHLVITELSTGSSYPSFYQDLGLSIWSADIVVVKSIFHFRWRYLLYNRKTLYVKTTGTTNVDVFQLKYTNIPRPLYPLDDIDSWR
jgi:microcystin degradation protein MlrC